MKKLERKLYNILACDEAIEWSKSQKGSFQKSWDNCPRGDWMLWLLHKSKSDKQKMVLASCMIVITILEYVPKDEKRPLKSILSAEAWVKGEATIGEIREVVRDVNDAAYEASHFSAAVESISHAAANAANTAILTFKASDAAYVAASACAGLAAGTSIKKSLLNSSKIVRKLFPKAPRF